jgi:pimeloyl-ACP methyl ester carboxylesterase
LSTRFAEIDGRRIAYEDTGEGRLPVILAHGFLMDRTMFEPQVRALGGDHRVITWDERGHGETVDDGAPFHYWDLAEDLAGLLDHLGIDRAVVGGMSQGGFIALRFALAHPERVIGLVPLDSQAGLELEENMPTYDRMHDTWVGEGPSDQLSEMVAAVIVGGTAEQNRPWIDKWRARPPRSLTRIYRTLMDRDDVTGRLGEIQVPALVVHGEADPAIPMERAEELCAGLTGCHGVVRVPGGHAANLTHPDAVNLALIEFLERLEG